MRVMMCARPRARPHSLGPGRRAVQCAMVHVTLSLLVFGPLRQLQPAVALENGLARTPPLGLSTWAAFAQDVNHSLMTELADAMVNSGLLAAGYEYLLVDDGWELHGCKGTKPGTAGSCRDASGRLIVDSGKFPNMSATAAYVHAKGLRFGLWFGHSMCADSNDQHERAMVAVGETVILMTPPFYPY